jgi:hypothetical protein
MRAYLLPRVVILLALVLFGFQLIQVFEDIVELLKQFVQQALEEVSGWFGLTLVVAQDQAVVWVGVADGLPAGLAEVHIRTISLEVLFDALLVLPGPGRSCDCTDGAERSNDGVLDLHGVV